MAKKSRSRVLTVCLLSPHALALAEFQRALPAKDFRLHPITLDSVLDPSLNSLRPPRAAVYLVDAPVAWPAVTPLVAALQNRYAAARVVVVAKKFTEANTFPLLRLGVKGLLRYAEVPAKLPLAVRVVALGGFWVPRTLLSRFVDWILSRARGRSLPTGPAGLSRRERDVLDALLENLTNKEIAGRLHISERTVKFHVSNVLAKFGVQRRADLIVLCFQHNAPAR